MCTLSDGMFVRRDSVLKAAKLILGITAVIKYVQAFRTLTEKKVYLQAAGSQREGEQAQASRLTVVLFKQHFPFAYHFSISDKPDMCVEEESKEQIEVFIYQCDGPARSLDQAYPRKNNSKIQ